MTKSTEYTQESGLREDEAAISKNPRKDSEEPLQGFDFEAKENPQRETKKLSAANLSLFEQLEPLFTQVRQPVQYIGGEVNSVSKDIAAVDVSWALCYPDAYEVGQSNQGLAILYELLNARDWILAERTFNVWPDLAALLRSAGISQFTWENHLPLRAFDVLGVSFSTELGYTNLLEILDLAQIPLLAAERGESDPLIIGGGHAAFNPEPIADFVDAIVLGDGEEAVLQISGKIREWKRQGRPGGREGILLQLAKGLAYVPQFYDVSYRDAQDGGQVVAVTPNRPGVPARPAKHILSDLDSWRHPIRPIVPLAQTVHERYSVEIFRGCSQGCRFCQAGMVTRPVRERNIETIGEMISAGLEATGLDEVGLLSLSSADHSEIGTIIHELADRYTDSQVSLSLPSTRVDAFNIELAGELSRGGRRTGLTFAPEGGTERMRKVINKTISEDDLISTIEAAFSQGWRQVKLYFMCGLPTETDEDVLAIADLAARVIAAGRQARGSKDVQCTISIGGFVPKPHTPFQWAGQCDPDTITRRLKELKAKVRADRRYGRAINVRYADAEPGVVEGLLARGDRRIGAVIAEVWRSGGRFDGWREYFDYQLWCDCAARVLEAQGLSLDWYTTRERESDEVLPWDHLDVGLERDWLWQDWQDALAGTEVLDCRWSGCYDCGVCIGLDAEIQMGPTGKHLLPLHVNRESNG